MDSDSDSDSDSEPDYYYRLSLSTITIHSLPPMPTYDDPFDLDDDFEVPLDGRLRRRRNATRLAPRGPMPWKTGTTPTSTTL